MYIFSKLSVGCFTFSSGRPLFLCVSFALLWNRSGTNLDTEAFIIACGGGAHGGWRRTGRPTPRPDTERRRRTTSSRKTAYRAGHVLLPSRSCCCFSAVHYAAHLPICRCCHMCTVRCLLSPLRPLWPDFLAGNAQSHFAQGPKGFTQNHIHIRFLFGKEKRNNSYSINVIPISSNV